MKDTNAKQIARLFAPVAPTDAQKQRFEEFLHARYGIDYTVTYVEDDGMDAGFRLVAGNHVFDWTKEGRLLKLKDLLEPLSQMKLEDAAGAVHSIKAAVDGWNVTSEPEEEGWVVSVGDGIAIVEGLRGAVYGEVVRFSCGITGMVQDLRDTSIGVILFGEETLITEGSIVRRTGRPAGIPVGDDFLGRVVNALGEPVDGNGPIEAEGLLPVEGEAPGIIDRQPVNTPMNTGLLAIDSMFPIGRGQRELIIGDRQTGKTTIAIDTIINQRKTGVICIYVAIGQKSSSIAQLVYSLKKKGAMAYTIVMTAPASESASMQYIAPYAASALGEHFMNKGKDVLIVYDDLSKHAIAYRALALLLERSPGREAYPGDVFYLHSRLLERSARLSDERGGGSMTALPVVETQAGDVAAYIPTNIISITDGQIFLESSMFNSGQRPAVNIGLSVSRVGGAAQTKAMKKAVGSLRLDLAQFREMEVFTQFASDLDEVTRKNLAYGQGLMRLLRQDQGHPLPLHAQVILLVAATARLFTDVPLDDYPVMMEDLVAHMERKEAALCEAIDTQGTLSDEQKDVIRSDAEAFVRKNWRGAGNAEH